MVYIAGMRGFGSLLLIACALAVPVTAAAQVTVEQRPLPPVFVELPEGSFDRGGDISRIIYLNRCVGGCTVTNSNTNNAVNNESSIPMGNPGQVFTITEFVHGDTVWDAVVDCVRDVYSPFDVTVVDEDPGTVTHHEVMSAGLGSEIGWPDAGGVGGGGSDCNPGDNVISFAFLNGYPANNQAQIDDMCLVIAQESAHSFGLPDHLYDCTDPMTYLTIGSPGSCPRAYFRNKQMPCGEFQNNVPMCSCGGNRVNSHLQLTTTFGRGVQPPPPTASFLYPADGAQITTDPLFQIGAEDSRGVSRIEIYMNGWRWHTFNESVNLTPPFSWPGEYTINVSADLPDGVYEVEARTYNDLGLPGAFDEVSYGSATITLNKGSPCSGAGDCLDGQYCENGGCYWDQPVGELGESCTYDQYCIGPDVYDGVCAEGGDGLICTYDCVAGVNDNCPEDYYCPGAEGENNTCLPGDGPVDPGCCSTGDDTRGSVAARLTLVLGVGVLLFGRKRRPTRTRSSESDSV